jgi:hypothetical protein
MSMQSLEEMNREELGHAMVPHTRDQQSISLDDW